MDFELDALFDHMGQMIERHVTRSLRVVEAPVCVLLDDDRAVFGVLLGHGLPLEIFGVSRLFRASVGLAQHYKLKTVQSLVRVLGAAQNSPLPLSA